MLLRDKKFLKEFFSLYWAIVLQNVIVLSVSLVDNIMLGGYNQDALSGAATVNQLQFFLQMIVNAFSSGLMVLVSQYWADKRREPIQQLTALSVMGGLLVSLILFVLSSTIPRQMLYLFTTQEPILAEGMKYLHIIRWTFPLFAIATVLQQGLQAVGTVWLALAASVFALFFNVILNALLIPKWGVEGAAIATLAARAASLALTLIYIALCDKKIMLRIKHFFHIDKRLVKDFLKVCAPLLVANTLWGISTGLQTVILGHMEAASEGTIAANSMATTLYSILKTASIGAASAAAIMMGGAVVSGDMKRIKDYARTLQAMFLIIGFISSTALFFLRAPILSFYNMRAETKEMANQFLLVLCVTGFGTAYQMPVITGIIRGGGDPRFGMINDIITVWGLVIPLSFLAAFVFKWSPVAVVICLNCDQIIKCAAGAIRCNRYRWVKKLTREGV